MRTRNAGDFVDTRSFEDTDHFDRIVAEPRNEHPTFAGSKMIETPFHAFERNLPCQDNGRRVLGGGLRSRGSSALLALTCGECERQKAADGKNVSHAFLQAKPALSGLEQKRILGSISVGNCVSLLLRLRLEDQDLRLLLFARWSRDIESIEFVHP